MRWLAACLALFASQAEAGERYLLDPSHSQAIFSYEHLGYSTTWGMFSGFEGEIVFEREATEMSSVAVSIPVTALFTGWEERDATFLSADFFGADENDRVTFASTSIEVTGESTGRITGDLTLNGITRSVVLDASLTREGPHPVEGKDWLGFSAETVLKRSDFDMGAFAPFISDEVRVMVSVEAGRAD